MAALVPLVGAVLVVAGLAMIAWPRQVWLLGRGWRFADPADVRLSDAYVAWLRVSGAVGVVMGIALVGYALR